MKKIIILDDMTYMRYRVKKLLSDEDVEVYEASNSFDFFNKLLDKKDEINLIILEVGLCSEDGFEILKKIKAKDLKIPIMVLTKMNTRSDFIKCIKEGTSEYILKPFDSKSLVQRINKLLEEDYKQSQTDGEIIHLNFQEYMAKQIDKAKQNKTHVSIMMMRLTKINAIKKINKEKIDINESYFFLEDVLYQKIKVLFKKSDLFVKYGFSEFAAVLPGYDKSKAEALEQGIKKIYSILNGKDYRYDDYILNVVFAVYPDDGQNKQELLDKLVMKMKNKLIL